ncbi:hypothetical protein KBK19_07510 [Microvirga sp. STR05]|uniref:Uncharacterized protein n=1 Tax=Hymenobacter duratus TaxID=2771356 RepID=A0ABR8JDG3_9BACT|nr:hypothetical protein [Hymenobacter duratus]MBD2714876.1 hypothetical protein [Hymenobacter duratus]MBR7949782.1 hypothetical protein [Microvirga sp. STR05]
MDSYADNGLSPDFRVSYSLYSAEEGGRKTPAYQHIRWDFRYDDESISTRTFHIWPEILHPDGTLLLNEHVPAHGLADMFVVFPGSRAYHQQHIRLGVRGYFVEGARRVAVCEVIAVLHLHTNPLI